MLVTDIFIMRRQYAIAITWNATIADDIGKTEWSWKSEKNG